MDVVLDREIELVEISECLRKHKTGGIDGIVGKLQIMVGQEW